MTVINQNLSSISGLRYLNTNSSSGGVSDTRVSSGLKINTTGGDDDAGLIAAAFKKIHQDTLNLSTDAADIEVPDKKLQTNLSTAEGSTQVEPVSKMASDQSQTIDQALLTPEMAPKFTESQTVYNQSAKAIVTQNNEMPQGPLNLLA